MSRSWVRVPLEAQIPSKLIMINRWQVMKTVNQKTFYRIPPVAFFCVIGLFSCAITHSGGRASSAEDQANLTPKIIFLNYSIKKDKSSGIVKISLINKLITEGKLKPNSSESAMQKPGDLKCIALNSQLEAVDSILISDPLNITVESVDQFNELFKKEIALDSAQFSVRMQLNEKVNAIGIRKNLKTENKDSYFLLTKIRQL
jgi:hypothetical protein